MHFGFALKLSDIDLLDTFRFVRYRYKVSSGCLKNVFKTSSRDVFNTSSKHVFKTSSRHVFKTSSRHVFKTSSRRLQRNNFSSSKTSSRRFTRCLQDVLEDMKFYAEDVFKMCLRHVLKTSSRPTNVCVSITSTFV